MPIQVDYEEQRPRVTALAARLITREGIPALTFRGGQRSGNEHRHRQHVLHRQERLLRATLRAAANRTTLRFGAAAQTGGELDECLEA
jgi:hypothetical protein